MMVTHKIWHYTSNYLSLQLSNNIHGKDGIIVLTMQNISFCEKTHLKVHHYAHFLF